MTIAIAADQLPNVGHPRNRRIAILKLFRRRLVLMEDMAQDEQFGDVSRRLTDALLIVEKELKSELLERELDVDDERDGEASRCCCPSGSKDYGDLHQDYCPKRGTRR